MNEVFVSISVFVIQISFITLKTLKVVEEGCTGCLKNARSCLKPDISELEARISTNKVSFDIVMFSQLSNEPKNEVISP